MEGIKVLRGTAVAGLNNSATRIVFGAIAFNSSTHLPPSSELSVVKPVKLPSGRERFATKPLPMGSPTFMNTMGIVRVSRTRAATTAVLWPTITSGRRLTNSFANDRILSASPAPQRTFSPEIATFRPTELCERPLERLKVGLRNGTDKCHQHTDLPHTLCLLSARRERPCRRTTEQRYDVTPLHSITSSARASTVGGMTRPRACAVAKLITSCNLVGNSIGRSPGFVPFKILSTKVAMRRQVSLRSVP